jgi:hypothetical protein
MTIQTIEIRTSSAGAGATVPLVELAWTVANEAYHVPGGELYRTASRVLYPLALHERIREQFARSDRQNAYLDAVALQQRQLP